MKFRTNQLKKHLEAYDRQPRERLKANGPESLSDLDLITILLGSGNRDRPVHHLAADLLEIIDSKGKTLQHEDLTKTSGIGSAKASTLLAALEIGRRISFSSKKQITYPGDIFPIVRHYADRQQEHFLRVSLNGAHEIISVEVVTIGLVNRTIVHPREVFSVPLKERATAIIVAHNHPSGRLEPSSEDCEVTDRIKRSGKLLGIPLLDHIIFSDEGYFSFLEEGKLQ
ncbi:MAG: DNA repair protein RadC [Spirochaetales bacterium]|jgi:DNA repair protein RadC|nr:DNA repair protein RadC [Spirochaetales bacterium]